MKILRSLLLLLFLPAWAHAGVLVDLTTGTSSVPVPAGGTSVFQVENVCGLYESGRPGLEDLDLEEGDETIKNLDGRPTQGTYTLQVTSIGWPSTVSGGSAANSGATFTVRVRWSNEDAAWSLSGVSTLVDGQAVGGNTRFAIEHTIPLSRFTRYEIEAGITPFGKVDASLLVP